ncbi:MAG: HDOD domain-containing protein [Desulfobacterales bacterium]|jgi:putative nucleotidyltransferase with HDIG domain
MTNLRDIVEQIDLLAPIPAIASQIMITSEDPDSSMSEIADLIANDPALTANLMKICNSAYFSLPRKVESLKEAVSWVGTDQIVELVLANTLSKNFAKGLEGYGLGEGELWRHAVTSAHVAKGLAHRCGIYQSKHLIFTAALLKDIGKLVLGRFVAFSAEKINILVHSQGYSFNDAEKLVIGMNHEELGALVGEKWSFSETLINIIRHHHLTDESARRNRETALVYLADIICMMMGICTGTDGLSYRFYGDVLKQINVTEKDLQAIIAETSDQQEKIEYLLKMF